MNNFILSISADQYAEKLNFSEALGFGGQMILLGMGAVFAVLGIICISPNAPDFETAFSLKSLSALITAKTNSFSRPYSAEYFSTNC